MYVIERDPRTIYIGEDDLPWDVWAVFDVPEDSNKDDVTILEEHLDLEYILDNPNASRTRFVGFLDSFEEGLEMISALERIPLDDEDEETDEAPWEGDDLDRGRDYEYDDRYDSNDDGDWIPDDEYPVVDN